MGAKSRLIIQGFHDPDIALLNRTVPTPSTSDVPLTIQCLSSLRAEIWVADVKAAFTQGERHQRPDRLFVREYRDGECVEEYEVAHHPKRATVKANFVETV